jgi:hypothetical protein
MKKKDDQHKLEWLVVENRGNAQEHSKVAPVTSITGKKVTEDEQQNILFKEGYNAIIDRHQNSQQAPRPMTINDLWDPPEASDTRYLANLEYIILRKRFILPDKKEKGTTVISASSIKEIAKFRKDNRLLDFNIFNHKNYGMLCAMIKLSYDHLDENYNNVEEGTQLLKNIYFSLYAIKEAVPQLQKGIGVNYFCKFLGIVNSKFRDPNRNATFEDNNAYKILANHLRKEYKMGDEMISKASRLARQRRLKQEKSVEQRLEEMQKKVKPEDTSKKVKYPEV